MTSKILVFLLLLAPAFYLEPVKASEKTIIPIVNDPTYSLIVNLVVKDDPPKAEVVAKTKLLRREISRVNISSEYIRLKEIFQSKQAESQWTAEESISWDSLVVNDPEIQNIVLTIREKMETRLAGMDAPFRDLRGMTTAVSLGTLMSFVIGPVVVFTFYEDLLVEHTQMLLKTMLPLTFIGILLAVGSNILFSSLEGAATSLKELKNGKFSSKLCSTLLSSMQSAMQPNDGDTLP